MRGARGGIVLWVAAVAMSALAAPDARAGSDDFWGELVGDITPMSDYEEALETGDEYARRAVAAGQRTMMLDAEASARRAIHEYERAAKLDPSRGEPHYRAAEVGYAHWVAKDKFDHEEAKRAIDHWHKWQKKSPRDPRLQSALFRRSIAYTKLGGDDAFRKALADYETQLSLTDTAATLAAEDTAVVVSNAAELYMGIGELDSAITLYQQALELKLDPLYGYGLAVALERDGQRTKAREVMRYYVSQDKLKALDRTTVFFVPEGDEHAYRALGHEALGDYELASREYRAFLAAQPHGRYADVARSRLEEIKQKKRKKPSEPRERDFELDIERKERRTFGF